MLTPPAAAATAPMTPSRDTITAADAPPDDLRWLRRAIWLYILLWLFEGALRKWFLPSLANPLLIVRDPVLLLIYLMAFVRGVFPKNFFVALLAFEGAVALVASIATTDVPMIVQFYGFHANFLHLPLIFLIPEVFNRGDIRRVGLFLLAVTVPMSVLVFLQFHSGGKTWINVGASGGAGMLGSAFGHIRPSGTFSFGNGLGAYIVLVSAFFLWQIFRPKLFPRALWLASGGAMVAMIALSGSRTTVGAVALVCVGVLLVGIVQPRYWSASIKLLALAGLAGAVVISFGLFKEGLSVFAARFGGSENVRTGFIGRYLGSLYLPFQMAEFAKPLGAGLGMGTNAAAGIINDGKRGFILGEGDIGRVIMESGPVIGITYELTRFMIALYCFGQAMRSLGQRANPLPILIFCGSFSSLIQGSLAQPTELGFVVITTGLCLAATKFLPPGAEPEDAVETEPAVAAVTPPVPVIRGRSIHAERMHQPGAGPERE